MGAKAQARTNNSMGLWLQSSGWSMDKINAKDPDDWQDYFPSDIYDFAINNDLELAE